MAMSTASHRSWMSRIAVSSNCVVLGINYRLAPEFPFPYGLLDALHAYRWLVTPKNKGGLGVRSEFLVIAGDSAGGGLSLATVLSILHGNSDPLYSPVNYLPYEINSKNGSREQQLGSSEDVDKRKDENENNHEADTTVPSSVSTLPPLPLPATVILISPWTDLECQGNSWKDNSQYCYLTLEPIVSQWYAGHHLESRKKVDLRHPLLSPIYGSYVHFPSLLIQVGEKETLYDDSRLLASAAEKDGAKVSFEVYRDQVHVFQMFGRLAHHETKNSLKSIARHIQNEVGQHHWTAGQESKAKL
eukprot:TRINITY_DN3573_c0_g1_i4.p1 TRINITY_DN3573_c0_g1~~TRINITY_DN3573_c0_g1_i4.p1  ORF type:complete len:302 (-),score=43.07 TRINITY_DN3573_c0_g1_i4:83-988(-)